MKKTWLSLLLIICLLSIGCKVTNSESNHLAEINNLQTEVDSLKSIMPQNNSSSSTIIPFFTFQKEDAEQAMNFYVSLFDNSEVLDVIRWEKGAPGKEGTIMTATFSLNGKVFKCSDSPPIHDWDFSPAIANYLDCQNESEIDTLFEKLSEGGKVYMPLNNYGFSQKFGWVADKFGVSWQLNLP